MDTTLEQLLGPYLTPEQAALLRYERTLPRPILAELCRRLRDELTALRSFVPAPLAIAPERLPPGAGVFWPGSLLCADLSGFTALTERLASAGRLGLEELSQIINRLFGALLAEVERYGGTVLKFSGDALTAFFGYEAIGEGHSAAACAAALAMQRAMSGFQALHTSAGAHQLHLRVGVHRGSPFCVLVGDDSRYELALTGHAMSRVVLLQERAAPGEVLISAEVLAELEGAQIEPRQPAYALLRDLPAITAPPALPAPSPPPPGNDLETALALAMRIAALRPFVPAALPRQVLHPNGRASGEFRPVSPLFVNVASFSSLVALLAGAEHLAAQAMQAYYSRAQRVIRWYGGEINKLDNGSTGDKLLALFGAPLAHEDDPLRASEAALDLGAALEQANRECRQLLADGLAETGAAGLERRGMLQLVDLALRQRIGVASGNVFAGAVGAPARREYTVIGRTVNLAARLMAAAQPGHVLLDLATAAATRGTIVVEPLAPLSLKGFDRPVEPARALRRQASSGETERQAAPLFGRDSELAALRALADGALAGAGNLALISGEPGLGKSRLATAALAEATATGARAIELSCRSYAQNAPYSLVRDLLGQLFQLPARGDPRAAGAALRTAAAMLAPELATFAPLLELLFRPGADPIGPDLAVRGLARLPRADQRERLHELVAALVVGAARQQPLALLIDDLHWADASSLEVVQRLAYSVELGPIFLLLCQRIGGTQAPAWPGLSRGLQIRLEPLDAASSRAMLAHLLGDEPPAGLEPLIERAQGSPLFLEALVQHLIDGGVLRREAGGWRLQRSLESASIPATIEPVLAAQLDRLDEASRELVQVAAVIGSRIPYAILAGVYSQARQPARRLLDLVRSGVLMSDSSDPLSPFRFRQTMLREVAYQSVSYARRRELHLRVAERIGEVFPDQIDAYAAELAHHYSQAADWPRAYAFTLRSARYSRDRHALAEAITAYERALQIDRLHLAAASAEERLAVLGELADVEAQAGRYDAAHAHYHELLERYATAPATPRSALAAVTLRRQIGAVYEQQGRLDEALEWLNEAHDLVQPLLAGAVSPEVREARAERGRICSAIGWAHFRAGSADQARHWLEAALRSFAGAGPAALADRARAYNRLGGVAWMRGDLVAARDYVERSLADFATLGDLLGQADAQNNLGILAEQRGDGQQAIESYRAALEANRQAGRHRAAALSLLNLGAALLRFGQPAEALPALEQAAGQIAEVGDALHENMALRWLGRTQIALGRYDEAGAALDRALELARAGQLTLEELDTHTALGELALARSDAAAAQAALETGQALYEQADHQTLEAGLFLRLAAAIAEQAGAAERAAELRAESEAILAALGMS